MDPPTRPSSGTDRRQPIRGSPTPHASLITLRDYGSPSASPTTTTSSLESRDGSPTSSHSSFAAPTASYTWPSFNPSAGTKDVVPKIYVSYKMPSVMHGDAGAARLCMDRKSKYASGCPASPQYTSLSSVTVASSPPLRERTAQMPARPPFARHASDASPRNTSAPRPSTPHDHDLQNCLKRLDIHSQHEPKRRRVTASPPYPSYSSESESSSGVKSPASQGGPTRGSTADPADTEWMNYAKVVEGGGSSALYMCIWVDEKDSLLHRACGYRSKKHLVKRHIESKHLQIKPIICEVCGKGFAQRTNYSTHMNTHTGAAPHKCPYPNCDASFGDPARRHRHMKAAHNHIPSKRRTQSDQGVLVDDDMDASEPEEEDAL